MNPRIDALLELTCPYKGFEEFRTLVEGNPESRIPSLYKLFEEELMDEVDLSDEEYLYYIMVAMGRYLRSYPAPVFYKNKMWEKFDNWIRDFADNLGLTIDEDVQNEEMPRPCNTDINIEILKNLHYSGSSGVTKENLASRYGVDERTIKNIINRIDSNSPGELRIAGQLISEEVKHRDVQEYDYRTSQCSRKRFFYLKSTINPIFMQLDIAQVHSLLFGLKMSYFNEERNLSLSAAVEIWSQLSYYTQNRIESVYCSVDSEFDEFIRIVRSEVNSNKAHLYVSERELLNSGELSGLEEDEVKRKLAR